jgi:type II secretory pathway component PulF
MSVANPEPVSSGPSLLRSIVATGFVLFCHFVALFVLLHVLVSDGPRFVEFYERNQMQIARITVAAIDGSHLLANYWYLLLVPGLGVDGIVYLLLHRRPKLSSIAAAWAVVPLMVTIILLGLASTAYVLPFCQDNLVHAQSAAPNAAPQ